MIMCSVIGIISDIIKSFADGKEIMAQMATGVGAYE